MKQAVKYIEGVGYYPFIIHYTLSSGKRYRMTRWSPGFPWVMNEVSRELSDRFGSNGIKKGSVMIEPQATILTNASKK